jgi:galactose mutarotase-like enzyme
MIELSEDSVTATINEQGAWVETLSADDRPVFFPKSELVTATSETKLRGGMHVCLPNFGPGGESGLAQHGFGRTSSWSVIQQNESSVLLELQTSDNNAGLVAELKYTVEQSAFVARLSLTNRGNAPLRVAPGFHPYFTLNPSETTVSVNSESFALSDLAGTEYRNASSAELITSEQRLVLTTENLSTWAIWTDELGSYVCVEPTFGGNRFLEPEQPDEQLAPGETKGYTVRISW